MCTSNTPIVNQLAVIQIILIDVFFLSGRKVVYNAATWLTGAKKVRCKKFFQPKEKISFTFPKKLIFASI